MASSDMPPPVRPGHNRASSVDDTQIPHSGGIDAAKRYRRRSFNGLEENNLTSNMASLQSGIEYPAKRYEARFSSIEPTIIESQP
ncbi:bud neck involved protein [Neocucurbitaria cava]|uniref:Bud neck involved protein n=1 Tax=Neocucurbitaria cava TaxID=798079 RepID=A0A9W8YC67_9PLEO|nr:bud neck involved protein [Neocucurbitaria cava]